MKIGILSDTHGYLDEGIEKHLVSCDEIWHAGDFGNISVLERLQEIAPLVGVYGNVDGHEIRLEVPLHAKILREKCKIWITHIGGKPGSYSQEVREKIPTTKPDIFICGHSHILLVKKDVKNKWLYINPGAAGKSGFHKVRTMMTLELENGRILNPQVIELGKRGV